MLRKKGCRGCSFRIVVGVMLLVILSFSAQAAVYPEAKVIVLSKDSNVSVTFEGSSSSYNNLFGLWSPSYKELFWGHSAIPGTKFDLGYFPSYTELIFFIKSPDGTFLSGPGERNPDKTVHSAITDVDFQTWRVGFEDLWGGGDRDYNDITVLVKGDLYIIPPNPQKPDFIILPEDITFSNNNPNEGDIIEIQANIHNFGNSTNSDVAVGYYDGDPDNGGALISLATINGIGKEESVIKTIQWDTTGKSGIHNIYVKIDLENLIDEAHEDNNKANKETVISIKPTIIVVSPNGGEIWQAGTTQTIQWSYTGDPGSYVEIVLLKNGVVDQILPPTTLLGTPVGINGIGTYSWAIPSDKIPGTDYQIRITSTADLAYTDTSDGHFGIGAPKKRPKGIDVSLSQHPCIKWIEKNKKSMCVASLPIDWVKVHDAGISFAWAKATEGDHDVQYTELYLKEDMDKGTSAKVKMGVYHFARPYLYAPEVEAKHFLDRAKDYLKDGHLRPSLDIENYGAGENPCAPGMPVIGAKTVSEWVNKWMEYVYAKTDVMPVIYTNLYGTGTCLDNSIAKSYDLWIAEPNNPLNPDMDFPNTGIWDNWAFWQYSWTGYVDGIGDGKTIPVDMDVLNGLNSDLDKYVIHKPSIVGISVPITAVQEEEVAFEYNIKNLYSYTFDYTTLAIQIRKSNSKDNWIELNDNKIINIIPSTYQYTKKFIIPSSVTPGNYDVKWVILDSKNGNWIDSMLASNVLKIKSASSTAQTPVITVVSPNSGEIWNPNDLSCCTVKWAITGDIGSYIDIELFKNGQVVQGVGVNTLTSTGSAILSIPASQIPGTDYQIKITSVDNSKYTDTSDGYFTIG